MDPEPIATPLSTPTLPLSDSIKNLVQEIRSKNKNQIEKVYGKVRLWGRDSYFFLQNIFIDINILTSLNSSRRLEIADLWEEFIYNPTWKNLDRIGTGSQEKRFSWLEIVSNNHNFMILGKPGSGKTTLLKRIIVECNSGKIFPERIPIFIALRDEGFRNFSYSLEKYIQENHFGIMEWQAKLIFEHGCALILLDGVDEVEEKYKITIKKQIEKFANKYPDVLIIITCRLQNIDSKLEQFQYIEIADLSESQVKSFSDQWFKVVCDDILEAESLSNKFILNLFNDENKRILEIISTPILLSLACLVFYYKKKFYSKRSNLYKEAIELLLKDWDKSKSIERENIYYNLCLNEKLDLLMYLAVTKFQKDQYILFEFDELIKCICQHLNIESIDSEYVLNQIQVQHGLLIERANKIWSFSHLTFQEFLVAKHICSCQDSSKIEIYNKIIANNFYKQHWKEVFSMAVELSNNPDDLVINLKKNTDIILKKDSSIENLISWIYRKVESINTKYKKNAVRAFYIYMFARMNNIIPLTREQLFHALDPNLRDDLNISRENAILFSVVHASPLKEFLCFALEKARIYDFFYVLNLALFFSFEIALDVALALMFSLTINEKSFDTLLGDLYLLVYLCKLLAEQLGNNKSKEKFEILLSDLPNPYEDLNACLTWTNTNRKYWKNILKLNIIENHELPCDFNLKDSQINILLQYIYANEIIAMCLKNNLSQNTYSYIESTLLTPK